MKTENKICKKIKYYAVPTVIIAACLLLHSCKKLIEVDLPIDKNTAKTVFSDKNTAVAAMTGVYATINAAGDIFTDSYGLSIRAGLRVDELTPRNPQAFPDYFNTFGEEIGWSMWTIAYKNYIYRLNSIIEGVEKSNTLSINDKNILSGEAKFTRAWIYFYLVNFYGDVPLVLTTDFIANASIPRHSKAQVYNQIVQDLKYAQEHLKDDFLNKDLINVTEERIRPNKGAATALLSRVYLYIEKWTEAAAEASKLINDARYEVLSELNEVFIKNSKEAIWQLQPNLLDPDGVNAPDGRSLINPFFGRPAFSLSNYVLNAFEPRDDRKEKWVTTSPSGMITPYKYKEGWGTTEQKEYTMVLRLSEQYLIRAEARVHLNKLKGPNSASEDINVIRMRAGLSATSSITKEDLLEAIIHERQVELFTEWGHRWLDLQRTGKLNEVMSVVAVQKGGSWEPYKSLLPIPYEEFKWNPSLRGHQNPGYLEQ